MIIVKTRLFQTNGIFFMALAFAGMLMFSGCGGDDTTGAQSPQVVGVAISPESVELEVGEQLEFSAFALTATGDTVDTADLDIEWEWWSTDPNVFTVEAGGIATGQNPGEAFCMIEATIGVGQNFPELKDELYVTAKFKPEGQSRAQTVNLELSAENRVISGIKNVSFKNRMRFTGRDSAFVMVF